MSVQVTKDRSGGYSEDCHVSHECCHLRAELTGDNTRSSWCSVSVEGSKQGIHQFLASSPEAVLLLRELLGLRFLVIVPYKCG